MNKQLICDYINYNAPRLHNLGDRLRAMIDVRYRLYHIGPDITPSQIISIKSNGKHLRVIADKGIKGIPVYKIPFPVEPSSKSLLQINDKALYQKYIQNLTTETFFEDSLAIFQSDLYWMLAVIDTGPFILPRWFIMDKYEEFISIEYKTPYFVIKTEDTDYNIVETPVDKKYIQDLIS